MWDWFKKLDEANREWKYRLTTEQQQLILLIIPGKSSKAIERKWNRVWKACKDWEKESNTKYNIKKTEIMFMEKEKKKTS